MESDLFMRKRYLPGLLFLFVWVSFIFTPFSGDLKVFAGSAHLSTYISDNLIVGAFKVWELKSVYSRLLTRVLYDIACTFVPFPSYSFEVVYKFLYSIMIILVSYISMRLIEKGHRDIILGTGIIATAVMAVHVSCQMQAEMTTTLLVLLAFSLYLNVAKSASLKLGGGIF